MHRSDHASPAAIESAATVSARGTIGGSNDS